MVFKKSIQQILMFTEFTGFTGFTAFRLTEFQVSKFLKNLAKNEH